MEQLLAPLLLAAALSLDAFVAALGFGAERIRIPAASLWTVSLICSAVLSLSLQAGALLAPLLPGGAARLWGGGLLALLGVLKLIESSFTRPGRDEDSSSFFAFICRQTTRADRDGSRTLSPGEAALLALALSADGLAAGVGAGAGGIGALPAFLLSAAVHLGGIRAGEAAGRRLIRSLHLPFGPVCGVLLLLLALGRLLG